LARTDVEKEEICLVYRKAARITVSWSYETGYSVATSTSRLQSELKGLSNVTSATRPLLLLLLMLLTASNRLIIHIIIGKTK